MFFCLSFPNALLFVFKGFQKDIVSRKHSDFHNSLRSALPTSHLNISLEPDTVPGWSSYRKHREQADKKNVRKLKTLPEMRWLRKSSRHTPSKLSRASSLKPWALKGTRGAWNRDWGAGRLQFCYREVSDTRKEVGGQAPEPRKGRRKSGRSISSYWVRCCKGGKVTG